MFVYILQVVLFQLLFLLGYEMLLKKETFFSYNRWYLLLSSLAAMLLPLIIIEGFASFLPGDTVSGFSSIFLPEVYIGELPNNEQPLSEGPGSSQGLTMSWWILLYVSGMVVSLVVFLQKYRNLRGMFKFSTISIEKGVKIIHVPDSSIACTFYKTIFLGDQLTGSSRKHILHHELVHVHQRHSLDLVFFEVLKVIFWFNPLVYLYQIRLAALHEFIADAVVVRDMERGKYYDQLLNIAFNTTNISFINQFFNHSLIKKRIVMLQKSKSKTIAKFKFLIPVPLVMLMLVFVACSEDKKPSSENANLEQYSYTLENGSKMTEEVKAIHKSYEDFLRNNPDYVSWATIDHETGEISYSVHSKEETVPSGYTELEYVSPDGGRYISYMNFKKDPQVSDAQKLNEHIPADDIAINDKGIPYGDIEEAPIFKDCDSLATDEERKKCTSDQIQRFVQTHFNTGFGKKLGLTGVNRIIVKFNINKQGNIEGVSARAPHPQLEEEAIRVISSLPAMIPGMLDGKEVSVSYSLPIVFQVGQ